MGIRRELNSQDGGRHEAVGREKQQLSCLCAVGGGSTSNKGQGELEEKAAVLWMDDGGPFARKLSANVDALWPLTPAT